MSLSQESSEQRASEQSLPEQSPAELSRRYRKRPLWTLDGSVSKALDRAAIERLIPHRDPFLLVDEITHLDEAGTKARGLYRVRPEDPVFAGHFPGEPVYPGVLQIEMMGQLGLCLLALARPQEDGTPRRVRALRVSAAEFLHEVLPGDVLSIAVEVIAADEFTATCFGQITQLGGAICATAAMEVYFVDP